MKVEGSAHVKRAEYSPQHKILTVQFHSGKSYSYQNVPPEKWEGFQSAESKGKYLHSEILPHHRGWPAKDYKWE